MNGYEHKALLYAEKYGIIDYVVDGDKMVYYEVWGKDKYECTVDLDVMKEARKLV
jgi:hypothetical protein